jgi:3-oxoacyl-[acyl-carrier-protein] synthase II
MDRGRRIVVTGMGLITPIGIGIEAFTDGLHAAKSAVGPITRFDVSGYRSQVAAEVSGFEPTEYFTGRQRRWSSAMPG